MNRSSDSKILTPVSKGINKHYDKMGRCWQHGIGGVWGIKKIESWQDVNTGKQYTFIAKSGPGLI